jgi:hypothetical protein
METLNNYIKNEVLMYDGTFKSIEKIRVGNIVMGSDSLPKTVKKILRGVEQLYEITQGYDTYIVNQNHKLSLVYTNEKLFNENDGIYTITWTNAKLITQSNIFLDKKSATQFYDSIDEDTYIDISVKEYLEMPIFIRSRLMGHRTGLEFIENTPQVDAYILSLYVSYINIGFSDNRYFELLKYLIRDNIYNLNTIGIPDILKINSRDIRLKALAGIIDNIGIYNSEKDAYILAQYNDRFTADIIFLSRSLGFSIYKFNSQLIIIGKGLWHIPVQNPTKIANVCVHHNRHEKFTITKKSFGKYYGIVLEPGDKYVLSSFIVTA